MKKQHEYVDRASAPDKGKRYVVSMDGKDLYTADITEYKKGACWATLTVQKPSEDFTSVYKVGDTFEVKVAYYEFKQIDVSEH